MPKETFFRLPETKQERIVRSALEEFAHVRFSEASINQIVKNAGIARGSFYQYFEDKEDLYRFLLERISKEKLDVFVAGQAPGGLESSAGLFDELMAGMPAVFDWAEQNPLYYRMGLFLALEEPELISRVLHTTETGPNWFVKYLEKAQKEGKIRKGVDLSAVMEILRAYSACLIKAYYDNRNREQTQQMLKAFFDILENGIRGRGEAF